MSDTRHYETHRITTVTAKRSRPKKDPAAGTIEIFDANEQMTAGTGMVFLDCVIPVKLAVQILVIARRAGVDVR